MPGNSLHLLITEKSDIVQQVKRQVFRRRIIC